MGFSNVGLGLVHGMAHPLGAYFDIPHGVANALLLPIVMQYNMAEALDKYSDIAKAMGVNTDGMTKEIAAQAAVDAVKALAIKVGIPEKLRDLNVTEESLEALALSAFNDVCTPGNPRTVKLEDTLELYKKAF
jgi:lactaldehyde reductase